jgi:N-acetyl-1-D-myo-inositol-2-amino-2-deoxy-alpha-D-glucopyranoside deacetylase
VTPRGALTEGLRALAGINLPPTWILVEPGDLPFGYPDDEVDAVIEAPDSAPAKVAAMRAHATQVTVEPGGRAFALSNNIALPLETTEHFVLVRGDSGPRDVRGWENDLLAGVNLG